MEEIGKPEACLRKNSNNRVLWIENQSLSLSKDDK